MALPKEPQMISELEISDTWSTTGRPQSVPFLIHDTGKDSAERVIIFGSSEQLQQLAIADRWFMDETFDTAPWIFRQLCVIRNEVGTTAVTCVYALMTGT